MVTRCKIRGFEVCRGFEERDVKLPEQATEGSAGYDFFALENTILPAANARDWHPTLVATGVMAYMRHDEVLELYNRSSNPLKLGLVLANGVGVVDSTYAYNEDNGGHIMFMFWNCTDQAVMIKKGQKIGQGVFKKYLTADTGNSNAKRTGGFGSTDAKN